jgi:antitoxin (DNA-binding transcriptional repressor) of toxin-antitoxin stability system
MVRVSVDEIKQNLSVYLPRVEGGETVIIMKDGKPLAEFKPIPSTSNLLRPFGLCNGEFIVPDGFDDPLPENIIQEFVGQ